MRNVIYKLEQPIEFKNGNGTMERVEQLEFKPLRVKHLKGGIKLSDFDDLETLMTVACRMSDQGSHVFDELEIADAVGVGEVVASFLGGSRKTGEKSLPS